MCLFSSYISFLVSCLFRSFAWILIWFCFYCWVLEFFVYSRFLSFIRFDTNLRVSEFSLFIFFRLHIWMKWYEYLFFSLWFVSLSIIPSRYVRIFTSGRISFHEDLNSNPFQYSCLGNPMDRRAWQAIVHGQQRVRHDGAHTHTHTHTHTRHYYLTLLPDMYYLPSPQTVLIICLLNTVVVLQYLQRIDKFQNHVPPIPKS